MGHIFISYSHKDTTYAHGLTDHLRNMGFDTWIDERLDYGSQWPHEIQRQLDSCDAFILIMTPSSFVSDWVQSELQRAKRKLKPIFPLLLEGDEPWLSVESTQYYDVRGEKFPDTRFYSAIKRVISSGQDIPVIEKLPKAAADVNPKKPRLWMKTEVIAATIGAVATVMAACAAMIGPLVGLIPREPSPTPPLIQPEIVVTEHTIQFIETATVMPTASFTLTIPHPTVVLPTSTVPPTATLPPTITPTQPIPEEERTDITIVQGDLLSCPKGYAIAGVREDRNQLLCRRVMRIGEEHFVETIEDTNPITVRSDMHACPWGMYMRGLNLQQNILLCSYDSRSGSPNDWQNEEENTIEIPGSVGFDMHICPAPTGSITYLTGIRADQNRFLCAAHKP